MDGIASRQLNSSLQFSMVDMHTMYMLNVFKIHRFLLGFSLSVEVVCISMQTDDVHAGQSWLLHIDALV